MNARATKLSQRVCIDAGQPRVGCPCTEERMPNRRRHAVPAVIRHSSGLALAVPEVVGHRLARMWLAGASPSPSDREEFYRMWTEKVAAFQESWNAMLLEMFRANLRLAFWPLGFTASTPGRAAGRLNAHAQRAAMAILGAGLAPIHRRASRNATRLRLTRR
jgi:hypothetical protein